jgi:hypothetical protein
MTNLLEKFDAVTIDASDELNEADRAYCEEQQAIYELILTEFKKLLNMEKSIRDEEKRAKEAITSASGARDWVKTLLNENQFCGRSDSVEYGAVFDAHETFAKHLVAFFSKKYSVELKKLSIEELLSLPSVPHSLNFGYYHPLTPEEIERARFLGQEKKRAEELRASAVLDAVLSYKDIVGKIIEQLGGRSFERLGFDQLVEKVSEHAHSRYDNSEKYVMKNGGISFNYLYAIKGWKGEYEVALNKKNYLDTLEALSHFETGGESTEIPAWSEKFISYHKLESEGIFAKHETGGDKVTRFKYYKNGKWEVSFKDHSTALEFARTYLKHKG